MLKKESPKSAKRIEHNKAMLSKLQDVSNFFESRGVFSSQLNVDAVARIGLSFL